MTLDTDPYRTLGLPRGATIDEVKRAYRRLAKINHPDAAGEKALPRFLAIQAAYEQLDRRPGRAGATASAAGRRAGLGRRPGPGRCDAPRVRRTGARSRAGRPAGAGPRRGRPAERPGGRAPTGGAAARTGAARAGAPRSAARPGGPRAGATGRTGAAIGDRVARDGAGGAHDRRPGRRDRAASGPEPTGGTPPAAPKGRKRNKATLGSTSYDGVDGPFEPDWRGASWYGTTSGTYWTLNPKEYADPRKHGPEYQARARRAARPRRRCRTPRTRQPRRTTDAAAGAPDRRSTAARGDRPPARPGAGRPTHTTSSWWDSTDRRRAADPDAGPATADRRSPRPTAADRGPADGRRAAAAGPRSRRRGHRPRPDR